MNTFEGLLKKNFFTKYLKKYIKSLKNKHLFWIGLALIFLTWGVYFYSLFINVFYWTPDGIVAGWIGVWADWSVHNTYASVFAYKSPADWLTNHPLFLGRKFTYPFLSSAISGWLIGFGVDRVSAFVIPSIITVWGLLFTVYVFFWRLWKSAKMSILGITLFLTSGGLGFWWWLKELWVDFNWDKVLFPPKEYTHIGEITLEWINVITGQILPQRALLLAIPLTLIIILILERWLSSKNQTSWYKIALLSVLTGLLIITHVHSFIVLVIWCGVWFFQTYKKWRLWLPYAFFAGLMSLMWYQLLYGGEIGGDFFKWYPGWLANEGSKDVNWLWFWFLNWGFFLPVAILGTIWGKWYKKTPVITGWILFILSNLFLFQPFDWDNSKILTWSYLLLCIPVADLLSKVWHKKSLFLISKIVVVLLFILLTFSGWLDVYRVTQTDRLSHLMWSQDDLKIASRFREISSPTDIVLTSDKHNHWVSALAGRQLLIGYKGWMWTYGIDVSHRDRDILNMFAGNHVSEQLLKQYNVEFAAIGYPEIHGYRANLDWYRGRYEVVLQNSEWTVFRVGYKNYRQDYRINSEY